MSLLEQPENIFDKIFDSIQNAKSVAIFTHPRPDLDALGSMMGFEWLIKKKFNINCDFYIQGPISHPQNKAMTSLLNLEEQLKSAEDYINHDYNVLIDTIPSYAGVCGKEINFNLIIDHHKENPSGNFNGIFLNLKTGSSASTVYELIKYSGIKFSDEIDSDSYVATALMAAISSDTENMSSLDTTKYETICWSELLEFRNPSLLSQIINFQRPKLWVKKTAEAVGKAIVEEGLGVVGIGLLDAEHSDLISEVADYMKSWEEINTAVVFAIIDGKRLEGSIRSLNTSVSVPTVCKELGNKKGGSGGGKLGKGRYYYDLGGSSIDDDDDDKSKETLWEALRDREIKRVFKTFRK